MRIPYVIDNEQHKLADVLNELLADHQGKSLDVATAYFTIRGFELLKDGLQGLGSFRLLLGAEPQSGVDLGLHPDPAAFLYSIGRDLEREPFTPKTLALVEDLIRYLRRDNVSVRLFQDGFLHAKCYLFYGDSPALGWDRFQPVTGIVGSSNFTGPGLTSNRELNLVHKAVLSREEVEEDEPELGEWPREPQARLSDVEERRRLKSGVGARAIADLDRWFEHVWESSRDFKDDLIQILDESKFGEKEYTPWQVYMKALYEYFKDDLSPEQVSASTRSAIELTEFQDDAVKKARRILRRYDGVMIADSVGLGKTWIGKKLLEDYAYHLRQQALVVCPASLREMWDRELNAANIAHRTVSQEELGRGEFGPSEYADVDIILVDESHNFRNQSAQRYLRLEEIIALNGGRGRSGERKKLILVTATPINNDLLDLCHQIDLFTQGDPGYFAAVGIGDLRRYFLAARRSTGNGRDTRNVFNLLEEVVIRRTRQFIRKAYPEAHIGQQRIHFPDRRLHTVYYDLEATYAGIYDDVVLGIEGLRLAPFNLEVFKKDKQAIDPFAHGRGQALVAIFKTLYLKRFESSVEAFRISLRRALQFQKTFESYLLDGRLLSSTAFRKVLPLLEREGEEDDATLSSLADEIDASEEARAIIEQLDQTDPAEYDLRAVHDAVQKDIEVLARLHERVKDISPERDAKLQQVKRLLASELRGKKVLLFSYFKDTAKYVYHELRKDETFLRQLGSPSVRLMDSDVDTPDRRGIIQSFAPVSNGRAEWKDTEREIDVLISTDVLSEGQNLQDCGYVINYDLHWNPTRMVQRAGRIDRIGALFDLLHIYNVFPDEGLERLLGIVQTLQKKIGTIDGAGMLDVSVLGETVHPRTFNTLRRIEKGDETVIDEEEGLSELATHEFMLRELMDVLGAAAGQMLEHLPNGIHSGLAKPNARGVFFYLQAEPGPPREEQRGKLHFWRYYDLETDRIVDNWLSIADLIRCRPETPRVVAEVPVFELLEHVIDDVVGSEAQRQALERVPKKVDPAQNAVSAILQGLLNRPGLDRTEVLQNLRFLREPMSGVQVRELRTIMDRYQQEGDAEALVASISRMRSKYGQVESVAGPRFGPPLVSREDLTLICFDVLS